MGRFDNQSYVQMSSQGSVGAKQNYHSTMNSLRSFSTLGAIDDLVDELAMPEMDDASSTSSAKALASKAIKHLCKPLYDTGNLDYLKSLGTVNIFVASQAASPSCA
jgi:hypothetical protein